MPFFTETMDQGKGLVHTGRGEIQGEDILGLARRNLRPPEEEEQIRYVIMDLTEAIFAGVTGDHIRQLAGENEIHAQRKSDHYIAIVAPGDHVFGISRMWQMLVEKLNWRIRIYRHRDEALAWIRTCVPEAAFVTDLRAEEHDATKADQSLRVAEDPPA